MAVQPRPRRIPQRTCIACRRVDAKRQLVRVVRTSTGGVAIDATGKIAGRGAYICADPACWNAALKRGAIERALRVTLTEADRATLHEYAQRLPEATETTESAMN